MRKIDKKINIVNANLLNEQRYLTIKEGLDEDWKTNVAAGLATVGGIAGANAQQGPKNSKNNQQIDKEIQHQAPKQNNSNVANPYGTDMSNVFGHTKPIFKIQTGVQDGKTGQPSVYVYHKDPNDPTFNVERDRETVYTQNLDELRKTVEYQDYLKKMSNKRQQNVVTNMDESYNKGLLENFNTILKKIL